MKSKFKVLFLGLAAFACLCLGIHEKTTTNVVEAISIDFRLEENENEETKPCKVVVDKIEHGKISTDILEGNVGDLVTITAKHDLLYKIEYVAVNGTNLIEDENTSGLYTFSLVEGDNTITASFIVDEELCGQLTQIVTEATEKDWTNLFSIENVVTLVKWLLDGGILIAMIRYYIKDKKLCKSVENGAKQAVETIVPDATKEAVIANTKEVIEPMFKQFVEDSALGRQIMCIMIKCMTLMQENTPEAKIAILNEFEKLKGVVDLDSIAGVKKFIEEQIEKHSAVYKETLERLENISKRHAENVVENKEPEITVVPFKDDGTQI